jgi:hypothetical protein
MDMHEVRDNPDMKRYELVVGERLIGIADYRRHGDVMTLPHTVIEPSERGRGWGEVLVRGALDDISRQGLRIDPQCWFVAEFVEQNPRYDALVA